MKKLLLGLALLATTAASAQVKQEKKYSTLVSLGKLSNGDIKYAGYVPLTATSGQVRIYNADHSLYRQAPITIPAGGQIEGIDYLSDRLFNLDNQLEFAVNISSLPSPVNNAFRVFNEAGSLLFQSDSTAYAEIYNTTSGTKMILQYYSDNNTTRVFSLGGSLTVLKATEQQQQQERLAAPYPNPTAASIRLPYELKGGQTATLTVSNVSGQAVRSFTVDNAFDHLLLKAGDLSAGVYLYRVVQADGTASAARRFVVQR